MYFLVLKKDAASLLFASFFGENNAAQQNTGGTDHVDGGTSRFDQNGTIYQAICGNCKLGLPGIPYPTTPGAWRTVNNGVNCNLTMVKIALPLKICFVKKPNKVAANIWGITIKKLKMPM